MNDQDLVQSLKTAITYHETQAVRYRKMLAIAGDDGLVARKPVTKKGAKAKPARPTPAGTTGRKPTAARQAVMDHLAKHPDATAAQVAKALDISVPAAAYHLAIVRKSS